MSETKKNAAIKNCACREMTEHDAVNAMLEDAFPGQIQLIEEYMLDSEHEDGKECWVAFTNDEQIVEDYEAWRARITREAGGPA